MMGERLGGTESGKQPNILVVGMGAIGGFYGGRLALAGARVSAVCRGDCEHIRANGLQVESVLGDFHFMPERVVGHPGEYGQDPPDYVLVTTKVLPESDTAALIKPVVGPRTVIVLIQNGIDIEPPVAAAFPGNEVLSATAFVAVSRTGPGRIRHMAYGRLTLGKYPGGDSEGARRLAQFLESGDIPCDLTRDIVTARWQKLVWNVPFNATSVLGGCVDTLTILRSPESASLMEKVMEDVCRAARATGHELPQDIVQQNIQGTFALGPYRTSMLLDFEAGRPMEVEAILGNAVRAARNAGVCVPHMESLYALLQLADQQNRRTRAAG